MAREKLIDGSNEAKAEAPEKEKAEQSLQHSDDKENGMGLPNEAICRQPCARWAGIAKKGPCKRPAPLAMGGAERHSWLKSIQGSRI